MASGRFIGGLLIGGALGAIIGLLLAPRSGEETRQMVADEFNTYMNRSMDDVKAKGVELRDKAKVTADQLREKGQQLAADLETTGRNTWDKVRSNIKPAGQTPEESPN